MKTRITVLLASVLAVLFLVLGIAYAAPAAYPTREIRYIVPYAPGGLSDLTARKLSDIIRQKGLLPVQLVVTNIEGASGGTGMMEVRGAARDGYTLLHHHTSLVTQKALGVRDWGFTAYEPIAMLFNVPAVLVAPGDSQFESFNEYVEYARNHPGELTWNVPGLGGGVHLVSEIAIRQLDIEDKIKFVAYGSGAPATTALLAGEDDLAAKNLPEVMNYVKSGQMKLFAIGANERLPEFPDVPTLKEVGIDTPLGIAYRLGAWAPKDTPEEIIKYMQNVFEKAINSPEFEEAARELGLEPMYGDGEVLRETFAEDTEIIEEIVKELDLKG